MVKGIVDNKKDAKIIVFNNYRDSALETDNELNMLEGVSKIVCRADEEKETGLEAERPDYNAAGIQGSGKFKLPGFKQCRGRKALIFRLLTW